MLQQHAGLFAGVGIGIAAVLMFHWCCSGVQFFCWRCNGVGGVQFFLLALCCCGVVLQPFAGVAALSLALQWCWCCTAFTDVAVACSSFAAALCCSSCSNTDGVSVACSPLCALQPLQQCAILLLALQRRGPFTGWRHCSSVDVADLSLVLHHTALSFTGVALQPFRWHCSGVALQSFC